MLLLLGSHSSTTPLHCSFIINFMHLFYAIHLSHLQFFFLWTAVLYLLLPPIAQSHSQASSEIKQILLISILL